jgi:hypothetical protein
MEIVNKKGKLEKANKAHQEQQEQQHNFKEKENDDQTLNHKDNDESQQQQQEEAPSWCSTTNSDSSSSHDEQEQADDLEHKAIVQHKPRQHRCDNDLFPRHCFKSSSSSKAAPTTATKLISPHEHLLNMTKAKPRFSLDMQNYFHILSAKDLENYTHEAIEAVRNLDMDKIRSIHKQGKSFQCSNAFGESLLHMACRHGSFELVHFFVREANVNIQCRDDVGRTPLHDACWSSEPNFQLIELIISMSPSLLLMKDKRGHAPLEYTRREHWSSWISFLDRNKDKIVEKLVEESTENALRDIEKLDESA